MPAASHQRLIDGRFVDPADRYVCQIFEAVAAFVLPEIIGGAIGGEVLGGVLGGEVLGGVLGGEALGGALSLGGGELLSGGLGLGELFSGGGGLAEMFSGGGADLLAGFGGGGDAIGGLVPGGALTTGGGAGAELGSSALSGASSLGSPLASPAALPSTVAGSPTTTGIFGVPGDGGTGWTGAVGEIGGDFGGGTGGGGITSGSSGTGSKGGFLDRTLSSITGGAVGGGDLKDLGTVLSGGMMLNNMMGGSKTMPGENEIKRGAAGLEATAAGQAALGTQLQGFLQSGKLPPGLEQGLRSATQSAHTTIKGQHAARGTSGSSAEASEIQAASDSAFAAGQQVALQLLQQGSTMIGQAVNTEGMASTLYQQIMANAVEQDKDLGASIANFSAALAGSGGSGKNTITLKAA